jgi:N-acetyltransferase
LANINRYAAGADGLFQSGLCGSLDDLHNNNSGCKRGTFVKIGKTLLEGNKVRLETLAHEHIQGLADAIYDGYLWQTPLTFIPHPDELPAYIEEAETALLQEQQLAFAIVDKVTGAVVGCTRFRSINRKHRSVGIGFTFVAKSWQRTHVNTETKYLMLQHAFEIWQCLRVELVADERNLVSRRAITRLGAREEGVLRNHMVMRDGFVRNSVVFSILANEWPQVKTSLQRRVNRSGLSSTVS